MISAAAARSSCTGSAARDAHQPWRARTWALQDPDADPTVYVPDHEDYNDAPRGSLTLIGNLPHSLGYVSPTNQNNYRNIIVTLTTRLSITFGWPVGDAEWAMGIARRAHGAEWGDFFRRGGAMTPGATERLMAAYLTWRGIPPPRSLESLIQRTLQPHVPPPQPGTYGNAAVARMMAKGSWLDGSSYSPRRTTATITGPPPRSRPRQRLGPRTYEPERRPRRPPHPPTHPPPPPPHPPPNHTNNTPPTPRGLQAIRHHLGPAHHRAPDKSVRPNRRRNDNQQNTTRPQGAGDTEHHLPGAEPYPAPQIRGRWVPSPGSPPALHTRTGYRPRAPQGARNP